MEIPDIDDKRNGLLLFSPLKYAFDRHQISFIGDDKGDLRLKIFDSSIRDTRLVDLKDRDGKRLLGKRRLRTLRKRTQDFDVETTFGSVDGRALAFTNLKRPFYQWLNFQARVAE
ncbi:hypothetical protein PHYSODRAFT_339907 [Phytophthora sojae]|uniref:HNH nuclease domain-containing protein n=1 Tax=Phytophthora sojae (strain P6497) TaxID=1094619 RepID=G5A806_PHYSP|nr:hypothetical protein PHYSODRAFT_339907 [Phytophthora sojae]EGZ08032.1 hypothetical protein PHYSODRAFT_339907 [Phytophthora sojae]|eukprot:XP_009536204.1 hypothetical protein PHYSODRAFT_339907 [Phytophthora sojae]